LFDFTPVWKIKTIEWKYLSYGKVISALRVVELLKEHFAETDTVYDLGCGAGGLSHFIEHYVGLDQLRNAIATAKKTSEGRDSRFVCGDGGQVPFKSGTADIVLSISMVEHMEDPAAAIKEARRICAGRGLLIIPCKDTYGFFYDPINFIRKTFGLAPLARGAFGYGHINVLSKDGWRTMIEDNDFVVEAIEPYDNSLFNQIEFFLFSLLTPNAAYEDIPIKILSENKFRWVARLQKFISLFDIRTRASFCQAFVVSTRNDH